MSNPALIVGVAGGTGSGKSTLARRIAQAFAPDCLLICHDDYYISHDELPYDQRAKLNYDHPSSLDTALLIRQLDALRSGRPVEAPIYDFNRHLRAAQCRRLEPASLVLVEGMLILESEPLRNRLDLKLFVDTDDDVRFIRRLQRDVNSRGRDMDSVIAQYMTTVKPMHERFVYPSRRWADLIIPEGGYNDAALSLITGSIRQKLAQSMPSTDDDGQLAR